MQYSLAILGLAALAQATPQGVTAKITPTAAAPSGCTGSVASPFQITVINATTSSHTKRQSSDMGALILTLKDGVLQNQQGDTGYEAANYQFQFDKPPQTGAIYTAGFSFCSNMTLALGGSSVFYQCNSGSFGNLYTQSIGAQCSPVYLSGSLTSGSSSAVSSASSSTQAGAASAISDGQPQAATSAAVSQISDHQPQAPTSAPVTQISDHQPQAPTVAPVSQISDHQPQAPTAAANATATYKPVAYTGGAAVHGAGFALAAGAVAVALL